MADGAGPEQRLRPTFCEVDLSALERNLAAIQRHVGGAEVMPVVKANAYGHGIEAIGLALAAAGVPCVGVAYVEEALALRAAGLSTDIHVLGGAVERQIPLFLQHDLILTAPSVDKLTQIEAAAAAAGTTARAHLKIDTGMERIGIHHYNADRLFEAALGCGSVRIEGVFSHFATADEPDLTGARAQLDRFNEAVGFFERRSLPMPTRHMAASGAIARLAEAHLDRVRPGILLYGVRPWAGADGRAMGGATGDADGRAVGEAAGHATGAAAGEGTGDAAGPAVEPVLSLHSEVVYFKVVPQGAAVGYGGSWKADRQTRIVTLPVGYADGYPRSAGGGNARAGTAGAETAGAETTGAKTAAAESADSCTAADCTARVLIDGKAHPVVGHVCMDQTMVDIGDASAYNGDRVTLIGSQGDQRVSAADIARWSGRSPYEVLSGISLRVPRIYRRDNKP